MIEYRKAIMKDIDVLTRMRIAMICEGDDLSDEFVGKLERNTERYLREGLKDGSFSGWVATSGDEIVAMGGQAFFALPPNDWCPGGKTAYIGNMYTLPGFRGQGIATRLLALVVDEAKQKGCERILLHADMGRPIYEEFGFQNSDTAMAYFPFGIRNMTL